MPSTAKVNVNNKKYNMKIDWCKILGHKWIPVYIIGWFGYEKVKFIATECKRCGKGETDLRETIAKMSKCPVNSYSEKYYSAVKS